jgi:hypothetical protein
MSETMTYQVNAGPPYDAANVRVEGRGGWRMVPAITHPLAPGLAVTMSCFGTFEVTHVPSGRRMLGTYERWGTAALILAELAAIGRAHGVDYTAPSDVVVPALRALYDVPVPFPDATSSSQGVTRPLTVKEWFQITRDDFASDEFPWESPDDAPAEKADQLFASLVKASTPTAEASP